MPVLTGIDILSIQDYIFTSNRLRDALAGSWMIEYVTSEKQLRQQRPLAPKHILMAAGGNAIIAFDSLEIAREWTSYYTRWLYDTAPGLEVVIAHREYQDGSLAWGIQALQIDLSRAKTERVPHAPQLGLSVTASCSVTGLPATDLVQGELVSPRIARLRTRVDAAKERWNPLLPSPDGLPDGWKFAFPDELDRMGRTHGQTSLLGVVHLDGNSVGDLIKDWLARCVNDECDDEKVKTQYGEWSREIRNLGDHALRTIVVHISQHVKMRKENGSDEFFLEGIPSELDFRLHLDRKEKTIFLPLRPILLGGDDLTFVCDGRISLDLAATAIRQFEQYDIPHLGNKETGTRLTACGGVALVKAHAPFRRSYELSERLCHSAKYARRESASNGSWLDWHIGTTRPNESIEDIRSRQYQQNNLTMRPYPLERTTKREQSWAWLDLELLGPGTTQQTAGQGFRGDERWLGSRNRVKSLSTLLSSGSDMLKRQVQAWQVTEPHLQFPAGLGSTGFISSRTPLLDAIELLDLHLRLKQPSTVAQEEDSPQTSKENKP